MAKLNKKEIAEILEEIALLLELKAANPFRVRAYRNAARTLLNLDEELKTIIAEKRLTDLENIGEDLAEKITTLFLKGHLPFYEKLKRSIPAGLLELISVQGLGAKKVRRLYEKLKITSLAKLKKACLQNKISKLKGFGKKTEQNILTALSHLEKYQERHLWWAAMQSALPIIESLKKLKGVKKVEIAGSLRRKLETIGDIDLLACASHPKSIMHWFTSQPFVARVLAQGETKSSVILKTGIQVDLRVVAEKQLPFALCYFTGSKEHNIQLRKRSKKRGWTLSEWGLVTEKGEKNFPFLKTKGAITEADIYKALGLSYIPPELREDRGEFTAALKNQIPHLVEEKDIRGSFHVHTTASDGRNTLLEMLDAAQKRGWQYLGIADHSHSSVQANGLSEETLSAQIEQIKKINASKKHRTYLFSGCECDILSNGTLDFSNDILKRLDYVIISVHSSLQQDEKTMTKRIIRAIEHPYSTMLGHPAGRLLLRRESCAVNVTKVIDACIANKKIIEINAQPQRLDMDWRFWHAASEKGLLCCINTDAHSTSNLDFITCGVNCARKGWLEKKHILNTRSLNEVQRYLHLSSHS
jgi:DNA polymerase (family X)